MILEKSQLKEMPTILKQTFQNKFTNSISKNQIIAERYEDRITDRDIEITKLLLKFKYATAEQVFEYLKLKGIADPEVSSVKSVQIRMDKLVQKRILNRFMLSEQIESEIHPDALSIYCMDLGGKYLLENFSSEDVLGWKPIPVNLNSPEIIEKDFYILNVYLKILAAVGEKLVDFHTYMTMTFDRNYISFPFEFTILHEGDYKYFLGDYLNLMEVMGSFRTKIDKYSAILSTNAWKKYYPENSNQPVLLFFTDELRTAEEVAMICSATAIEKYRLTTDELIEGDLSVAFLSYKDDKLKQVKNAIFTK